MKWIVGLGNPGGQYRDTRHNLGFSVVDALAEQHNLQVDRKRFHAWMGTGMIEGRKVLLAKPVTFVNRSGQAVVAMRSFFKLELSHLLVVLDDMALPLGKLRFRAGGTSGGHQGLADIIESLGTEVFARLRIGIGPAAAGGAVKHVLGAFGKTDKPVVEETVRRAADGVSCWVQEGIAAAMNRFNPLGPVGSEDQADGPRRPDADRPPGSD